MKAQIRTPGINLFTNYYIMMTSTLRVVKGF